MFGFVGNAVANRHAMNRYITNILQHLGRYAVNAGQKLPLIRDRGKPVIDKDRPAAWDKASKERQVDEVPVEGVAFKMVLFREHLHVTLSHLRKDPVQ